MYIDKEYRSKLGKEMDNYLRENIQDEETSGAYGRLWECQMVQRKKIMRIWKMMSSGQIVWKRL